MSGWEAVLLIVAALLGGAQNAVAGGGSFLTFPSLVFAGLSSVQANATSCVALWPGTFASVWGFRKDLRVEGSSRLNVALSLSSLVGGVIGALLLVVTPEEVFDWLVPFLLLLATVLFAFGDRLRRVGASEEPRPWTSALAQFPIAIYGGYFGGGMGLMMLALFSLLGLRDLHRMNGLKAFLSVGINGVAVITFALSGLVEWRAAGLMVIGAVAGGYGGAAISRKIDQRILRAVIVGIGLVLTVLFFARATR